MIGDAMNFNVEDLKKKYSEELKDKPRNYTQIEAGKKSGKARRGISEKKNENRNSVIVSLKKQGFSVTEIARKFNIDRKTVYRVLEIMDEKCDMNRNIDSETRTETVTRTEKSVTRTDEDIPKSVTRTEIIEENTPESVTRTEKMAEKCDTNYIHIPKSITSSFSTNNINNKNKENIEIIDLDNSVRVTPPLNRGVKRTLTTEELKEKPERRWYSQKVLDRLDTKEKMEENEKYWDNYFKEYFEESRKIEKKFRDKEKKKNSDF